MNSIRESCKSIEELDLGGNKLTDLIEVYKILQCTPNLKFLNLSENDLSRSSPVAMAATCSSSTLLSTIPPANSHNQSWSSSSITLSTQNRLCLAPINQNQLQQQQQHQQQTPIGTRRHSTLGQPTNLSVSDQRKMTMRHPVTSRVAEARRLAAAHAVAQSKKTSSSVASKLTHSASASGSLSNHRRQTHASCPSRASQDEPESDKPNRMSIGTTRHHQGTTASTMHLARSLSSLSAKDVRAASSSLGRLTTHHRASVRKLESGMSMKNETKQQQQVDRTTSGCQRSNTTTPEPSSGGKSQNTALVGSSSSSFNKGKTSAGKLFVEPIVENDDVDMNEQQMSPPTPQTNVGNNQQQSSRALVPLQTGNSSSSNQSATNPTPTRPNHLGSFGASSVGNYQNQSSPNYRRTFESIKALALNNTGCQWRVVCSILSRMPNLEELHLSLNNYERIDLDINEFKHYSLKRLYLCNNPKLTNWEELDKLLIAFPSLEALSIADCNISQIPDNLDRAREWRKLCGLNINGWPIKEWPVIERLNQLPSLVDLRCRNLEVLNSIDEPRHHLIARLPKLQRLNGSEIEEREHAEKAFLRFFMANSHLERPTRFHELVQIHGEITPVDVDVNLSPPSQAHVRVIYLNRNHYRKENQDDILMSEDFLIKLMDNVEPQNVVVQQNSLDNMEVNETTATTSSSSPANQANNNSNVEPETEGDNKLVRLFKDEGQEVLAIEIDLRQSVRKFKSTLASLFGLSSQNLILYYIDHEMVGLMGPELIKHNQKKLWNYNVQDGDQFIVEER